MQIIRLLLIQRHRAEEIWCDNQIVKHNYGKEFIKFLQQKENKSHLIDKLFRILASHPSDATRKFNIEYQLKKPAERTILDKIKKFILVDGLCI